MGLASFRRAHAVARAEQARKGEEAKAPAPEEIAAIEPSEEDLEKLTRPEKAKARK